LRKIKARVFATDQPPCLAHRIEEDLALLPTTWRRRLERQYGADFIRDEYQQLTDEEIEAEKAFRPLEGW